MAIPFKLSQKLATSIPVISRTFFPFTAPSSNRSKISSNMLSQEIPSVQLTLKRYFFTS